MYFETAFACPGVKDKDDWADRTHRWSCIVAQSLYSIKCKYIYIYISEYRTQTESVGTQKVHVQDTQSLRYKCVSQPSQYVRKLRRCYKNYLYYNMFLKLQIVM